MIPLYVICCETTCLITFFVIICCLHSQDTMPRHSGKSQSRGERLAATIPSKKIHGTQNSQEQESEETHVEKAISPLRNKESRWKANPVTKDHSTIIRSNSAGSNHTKQFHGSFSSNSVGITKSSSTGSTPKQSTPFTGGHPSNRQDVNRTASATKDIDRKEHQQSTTKKKKDLPRSPTNSDEDTTEEMNDKSVDYGNGHAEQKRRVENGRNGTGAQSASPRDNQKLKQRTQRHLESSSEDEHTLQTSLHELPGKRQKTSHKSNHSKNVDTSHKTAIGNQHYMFKSLTLLSLTC